MSGQDLFELARLQQPEIDEITLQWGRGKQRELDEQRGRGKHNVEVVVEIAQYYHLGDAMLGFLMRYTNLGEIGRRPLMKLLEIWNANKKENFMPKYPSEYLLVKLLEP